MSGHSKWNNIAKRKGANDAKKAKIFTKIGREMAIAIKEGGSANPDFNARLRDCIAKAKANNMPNDNIKRVLEKAASAQRGGASFDEVCRVVEELQRHTHLLFSLESMHNLAQNGRISKLAATAAGVLGIRAVGQASAEGTLEMLGKCRGERKTQEFLLQEMERLGYKGGSVRIGHCGNAAFSLELYTELRRRFPNADVRRYPLRGLCSYYAERGGIMMGFET